MADTMREQLDEEAKADAKAMAEMRGEPEPEQPQEAEPEQAPEPEQPAAEAAPEPVPAEPEPAPAGEPQMVPLAALQESRRKEKEARERQLVTEQQFREMQQQLAEMRGRVDGIGQQRQPEAPKPPEDPEPNKADDYGAWLEWRTRQSDREVQALKDSLKTFESDRETRQKEQEQASQYQQVMEQYATKAREFATEAPDFQQAYQHLIRSRVEELQALGYQPQQAVNQARQEELTIAVNAMSQGANPAERLYNVAKMRGYQQQTEAAPAPTAQQPAPAPAPRVDPQKRAQVAKSLSTAPGAPSTAPASADLANMNEDEYMRQVPSTDAFRRLMGG